MPRCGCSGSSCSCLVEAGGGIEVTGNGSADNPYVVSSTGDVNLSDVISFVDTTTVDFTVTGDGTSSDPWTVQANAVVAMDEITDFTCASPEAGDVVMWDGSGWICSPVSAEPGAIITGDGISGDGSAGAPLTLDLTVDHGLAGSGAAGDPVIVDTISEFGAGELTDWNGGNVRYGTPVYVDDQNHLRIGSTSEALAIPQNRLAAAGFSFSNGATMPATAYVRLQRFGPLIFIYCSSIEYQPSGATGSGNVTNETIMTVPPAIRPGWATPLTNSLTGRTAIFAIAQGGGVTFVSSVPIEASTWPRETFSFGGLYLLDDGRNPNTCFDALRGFNSPVLLSSPPPDMG
jgi:hypothetical protein